MAGQHKQYFSSSQSPKDELKRATMWGDDNGSYAAGKNKKKKKGKKRKNFQRGDDRGYGSGSGYGGGGGYTEGPPREHIQLVSDDMLQYVKELANQLQGDEIDDEGKEILVTNALEEFIGKETQICKDPVCSRAVETLVNLFTTTQLTNFMASLSQGDAGMLVFGVRYNHASGVMPSSNVSCPPLLHASMRKFFMPL